MSFLLLPQSFLSPQLKRSKSSHTLSSFIDNGLRRERDCPGQVKKEEADSNQWSMPLASFFHGYQLILVFRVEKPQQALKTFLIVIKPNGLPFHLDSKYSCPHLLRVMISALGRSSRLLNFGMDMNTGRVTARMPAYLPQSSTFSKFFDLIRYEAFNFLPGLEQLIKNSFARAQPQLSFSQNRAIESIYRYSQMLGIYAHLGETQMRTQRELREKERCREAEIKRVFQRKIQTCKWLQKTSKLFQNGNVAKESPSEQKWYQFSQQQNRIVGSLLAMPLPPRSKHPYQNNMVLNYIYADQPENIALNKTGSGGFSSIYMTQIQYQYVFSSQGHEVIYPHQKSARNLLHKFVIIKKQEGAVKRNNHELEIISCIKNGVCIFLPKYYILINQPNPFPNSVILDFIPFKNLREYIQSEGRWLSPNTQLCLGFSLLQSLRYISDYQIVHLDLKPSNIMVFCNLLVKLIDFGESYHPEVCAGKFFPGYTLPYSPPEIHQQQRVFTSKCDVFSFGIVLYELLYRRRPFEISQDRIEDDYLTNNYLNRWYFVPQYQQRQGQPLILRTLNRIISLCLEPQPHNRPHFDWIAIILRICLELTY